ncbi:UPF0182 family membrane protein [Pseudolysinimonas sp.]|uniref:UPF0182 family membrane protein n=1 Tax=Pseudolysinimonas sp. TaxID=2680009 RepID=UPI003F7E0B5B
MSTPTASATAPRPRSRTRAVVAISAIILAVLVIAFFAFAGLYSDVLWYQQLGFLNVLTTQWAATVVMFLVGFAAMALGVGASIVLAFRLRPMYTKLSSQLDRYQQVIEPLRRVTMYGIPLVLGVFMGVSTATRWQTVLQYLNRTSFGTKDPQFGLDASFYVYELPFWHGVLGYASAVILISGLAALATTYLYGGIRISGREVRISRAARMQLAITAFVYLAVQAVSIWLDQFSTVTSQNSIITGADYVDVNATIPGRLILAGIAAVVAILCLITAAIGRWRLPLIGTGLLIVSALVIGAIYPAIIQNLQVNPSPPKYEASYISRNITATRDAYGVNDVRTKTYDATTDVAPGQLRSDADTTASIRILDPALVTRTFSQLQQIRQYYQFPKTLDVDRYTINGQTQDTVLGVRELDIKSQSSPTWYNNTLVYTHGYGIVAAAGNQRTDNGQPVFLESGIPTTGDLGITQPRVYFGENSPPYSIVGAKDNGKSIEFDYPSGSGGDSSADGKTTTYSANGGPKLDDFVKRLVYATKFQSSDILFSSSVKDQSQILYDRSPKQRVKKVAPYLTVDSDPYPAVVNGRIVWIVDAYTTTADYPYSSINQLSNMIADSNTATNALAVDDINYIRNSVKATVDAYSGKVTLYAWDAKDPLLKTWQKIFPATVKPKSAMSTQLLAHVRYPQDLFKAQRSILEKYHVTNPTAFYNSVDAWSVPDDPVSTENPPTLQPPYYLTMQVPGQSKPGFTLYSTYIPNTSQAETRSTLTGYLAVDSDAGSDYGKLTLLTLPKGSSVPGPGRVQNTFDTDTTVSTELNLLRQGQTKVVSGNLLTLPVGGGLLYVQPVYVESNTGSSYPVLRKVLVAFGDKIAFEDTLDGALNTLFGGNSGASAGDQGSGEGGTSTPPSQTGGGTSGSTGGGSAGGASSNAALQKALQAYQTDLQARQDAYAKGDLVAAAEADSRMQKDVQDAIAASGAGG